jgi:peptidoglycan/LPS O-acetylase OafA/YrhL
MPYFAYIDGLRALAVLAVILFHSSAPALPGGFLGVDVFFVISGFLITRLLVEPSQHPLGRRLGGFYLRRARRILPGLLSTSLAALCAGLALFLPADLIRLGKYLLFAPLMIANVASALDGGYFAVTGPFTPLKHFWSLAVEEQFYVVYPLVLGLPSVRLNRNRTVGVLTTIAILSLAFCIRGVLRHSTGTFYLMPARAWELMFGALAGVVPYRWLASRLATEVCAGICAAVIIASFLLFNEACGLPYPYATIPCAATALLLYVGRNEVTAVSRCLAVPPLAFTGRISYSLYLWHAPILAFYQYYTIRKLTVPQLLLAWLAIYATATLSWRFIEEPIRRKTALTNNGTFVKAAVAMCAFVAFAGLLLWRGDGLPWRFSDSVRQLTVRDYIPLDIARCMDLPLERVARGDLCEFGSKQRSAQTAVLWGDSHAMVLVPAFDSLATTANVRLMFAGRRSCQPLRMPSDVSGEGTTVSGCRAFNEAMLSAIRSIHPAVTIIAGFWFEHAQSGARVGEVPVAPQVTGAAWDRDIRLARAAGSAVCVVLDVPHLPYSIPYAQVVAHRRGLDTAFLYASRAGVVREYAPFESPVLSLEAAHIVTVVNPRDVLCAGERCEIDANGRSLYRDANHLSLAGALYVKDTLAPCLHAGGSPLP